MHYVHNNQKGILCDICNVWHHANCVFIDLQTYNRLSSCKEEWYCSKCLAFVLPFSNSSNEDLVCEFFFDDSVIDEDSLNIMSQDVRKYNFYNCNRSKVICNKFSAKCSSDLSLCSYYDLIEFTELCRKSSLDDLLLNFHINCRSLSSNYDSLVNLLDRLQCLPDVIALTETWLHPEQVSCFQIDEYKLLSKPRASQSVGGGVGF